MGDLKLNGATSGTITLTPAAVAGTTTITLPATTGTVVVSNSSGNASVSGDFTVGGTLTASGALVPSSSFKRNRIINGNMLIDQRNAGASVNVVGTSAYAVDRFWATFSITTGTTAQQSTAAPSGFTNSLKITVGTGGTVVAGTICRTLQAIEGLNLYDLGWGSANAQTVTLSFWVQSSVTGTFAGGVYNGASNRTYVFTYAINSANTWEYKTVTIAGDTSGTWAKDNSVGMYVNWDLGTGSTYQAVAGSWGAGAAWSTSTSVKLASTTGATFYITGVQLEVGTAATPYEMQIYSDQLAQCQRYFQFADQGVPGSVISSVLVFMNYQPPVQFRVDPTLSLTAPAKIDWPFNANYLQSSANIANSFPSKNGGIGFSLANFTGLTTFAAVVLRNDGGKIYMSAEL